MFSILIDHLGLGWANDGFLTRYRHREETQRQREEGHVKTEIETGITLPQEKEQGTIRNWKR